MIKGVAKIFLGGFIVLLGVLPHAAEAATSTFVPAAGANTPVDGFVRNSGVTYSTTQSAGSGNSADVTATNIFCQNTLDTGTFFISRSVLDFDTSSLGSGAIITSATLTLTDANDGNFANANADTLDIVGNTLVATNNVGTGDYGSFNTTVYGSLALSSWTAAGGSNVITLSNTAVINTTGITKIGVRMAKDISVTAPSGTNRVSFLSSDNGGSKPTLTVNYTMFLGDGTFISIQGAKFILNGTKFIAN